MILFLNPLLSNISDSSADEEIIDLYLKTQKGAYFDIIYKRYSSKVYAKCISLLNDEALAQDAVQDIFIKVLTNLSRFGGRSKFSSWLFSISYNHCIDFIRKNKKRKSVTLDKIAEVESRDSEIEDKILLETKLEQLKVVLEEIPAKDKAILLMKYQDGMSIKDICAVSEKSESAVKMQIKRAKQKFLLYKKSLYAEEV